LTLYKSITERLEGLNWFKMFDSIAPSRPPGVQLENLHFLGVKAPEHP
jgi:hypothetical protein